MVSLTFHGGVNEIGGNKILLEDQGTRLLLDFGMGFGRRGMFFEEFLTPRTANGIGDFLATGVLPDLKGVYREDLIAHLGRKPEERCIDAVILSHAHADHANYISFLHKDIPVYCGETSKAIIDAIEEQSARDIENEVVNFKPRPLLRKDYSKPPIQRKFVLFRTGRKLKIGSLEIEPIHVDHSVPGAYGFIIHTSSGALVYTGDLRLHGAHSEMTKDFVSAATDAKPVAMITEGTRVNKGRTDESEQKVYADSKSEIMKNDALCIADFNFKDVDRFMTFYKIACETQRKLVISFKHACFLEKYHRDQSLKTPDSKDGNVMIMKPKRMTGTYCDEDYTDAFVKQRLSYPNIVTAEEVAAKPSDYLVVLNYWYFNSLVDLCPVGSNGLYIHSLSEPFNEEMGLSHKRMMNWLSRFSLRFMQSHCSGHINGLDLHEIISTIAPKRLFPIHTEHPESFKCMDGMEITRVEEGKRIEI